MSAPERSEVEDIDALQARGFQIQFLSHARAILSVDFPEALTEICGVLSSMTIPIEEIVAGGGGESKGTQRLRRALAAFDWTVKDFVVQKIINGVEREAITHKMDHVKTFDEGTIAIETEWNNKDPFFDRDLENFKRLHAEGAISLGMIITRGESLHDNMWQLVRRFVDDREINSFDDLRQWGYEPTSKQRLAINKRVTRARNPVPFRDAFVDNFVANKFGEATTHWAKLETRVDRGVGNPCPLLLVGLPDSVVTFHEGKEALQEVLDEEAKEDASAEGET
jgi:hypothetical protein